MFGVKTSVIGVKLTHRNIRRTDDLHTRITECYLVPESVLTAILLKTSIILLLKVDCLSLASLTSSTE